MGLTIALGLSNFHHDDRDSAASMLSALVSGGYCYLVRDVVDGAVLQVKRERGGAVVSWLDPADATARAILSDTEKLWASIPYDLVPELARLHAMKLSLPTKKRGKFKLDLPEQPKLHEVRCSPISEVGGWGRYKTAQKVYDVANQYNLIVHAE